MTGGRWVMSDPLRAEVRKSAASPRRISRRDRWGAYTLHHRQIAADSLLRLLRHPLGSLSTWVVIGIALALPGMLYVALDNIARLGGRWVAAPQTPLFLQQSVDGPAGLALQQASARRGAVGHGGCL